MLIVGCTSIVHEKFTLDDNPPYSLAVDARQRFLLNTSKGGESHDARVVCAEPSPDVLSALAAALGAQVSMQEKADASISASLVESAAQLGPRTQTVQLLRDGLYRACEAYLNGLLTKKEYRRILLGYDEAMITLLAIDGLTQLGPRSTVYLGGDASVTSRDNAPATSAKKTATVSPPKTDEVAAGTRIDPATAQVVKDILSSYQQFQLRLKCLFLDGEYATVWAERFCASILR